MFDQLIIDRINLELSLTTGEHAPVLVPHLPEYEYSLAGIKPEKLKQGEYCRVVRAHLGKKEDVILGTGLPGPLATKDPLFAGNITTGADLLIFAEGERRYARMRLKMRTRKQTGLYGSDARRLLDWYRATVREETKRDPTKLTAVLIGGDYVETVPYGNEQFIDQAFLRRGQMMDEVRAAGLTDIITPRWGHVLPPCEGEHPPQNRFTKKYIVTSGPEGIQLRLDGRNTQQYQDKRTEFTWLL